METLATVLRPVSQLNGVSFKQHIHATCIVAFNFLKLTSESEIRLLPLRAIFGTYSVASVNHEFLMGSIEHGLCKNNKSCTGHVTLAWRQKY